MLVPRMTKRWPGPSTPWPLSSQHCRYWVNLDGTPGTVSHPGEIRVVLCAHDHGSRYCVQQCARFRFQHRGRHSPERYHRRKSVCASTDGRRLTLTRGPRPFLSTSALETAFYKYHEWELLVIPPPLENVFRLWAFFISFSKNFYRLFFCVATSGDVAWPIPRECPWVPAVLRRAGPQSPVIAPALKSAFFFL